MVQLVMLGCGRMGGALARGWRARNAVAAVTTGSSPLPGGVTRIAAHDLASLDGPMVVVIAVKPQVFAEAADVLTALRGKDVLYLSIMAGCRHVELADRLGAPDRIVRAMPNLPTAIGAGMTVAFAPVSLSARDRATVTDLLAQTGMHEWVESEDQLDAATALSGSGPAYFYRFADAGATLGLPSALAARLVHSTFTGSAALAASASHDTTSFEQHIALVASPGGTTEAGLSQFDADDALTSLCNRAVSSALARAREIAGDTRFDGR
jgi:pyrroline-5-carboxylate reductase